MASRSHTLALDALKKSSEVRSTYGYDQKSPICIYGLCEKMGLTVRFIDVNMEGMYVQAERPTIFLSSLRPIPRRVFTCAHETGHHVFGHGATIDELVDDTARRQYKNPNELVADSFAGHLLMPAIGIKKAFASRGWSPGAASPLQIFTVSCAFGVGYSTLISHMTVALGMLEENRAGELHKWTPLRIREKLLSLPIQGTVHLVDEFCEAQAVDLEVGSRVILPADAQIDGVGISKGVRHSNGLLFQAVKPGVFRAHGAQGQWAKFLRVSRSDFIGLSENRHLEDTDD